MQGCNEIYYDDDVSARTFGADVLITSVHHAAYHTPNSELIFIKKIMMDPKDTFFSIFAGLAARADMLDSVSCTTPLRPVSLS